MAATLNFEFTISEHTSFTPVNVNITIDERRTPADPSDDVPVDMAQDGKKLKWTGKHQLPTDLSIGIFIHVSYRGTPGKQWHLKVVSDRPDPAKARVIVDRGGDIPVSSQDWSFWLRMPQ